MLSKTLLVFLLLSICIPDLCHSQEPFAGPFRIVMRQLEQCEDSGTRQFYASSTRLSKVSRTKYVYSANITTKIEVNDDMAIELDIAVFGNGGWRPHFMQFEFPHFCTFLKQTLPDVNDGFIKIFHSECPVPPVETMSTVPTRLSASDDGLHQQGTYEVKDFDVGAFDWKSLPKFPYGKYRVDFFGKINDTLIGCYRYYCDIIPLKREHSQKNKKKNS